MLRNEQPAIAFLASGFMGWTGGVDFLRLCIGGVDSLFPESTWPILVPTPTLAGRVLDLAMKTKRATFAKFGKLPAVTPAVTEKHLADSMKSAGCSVTVHNFYGSTAGLSRLAGDLRTEVILPCYTSLGRRFPRPWIGYIADLQHRRLPGNFGVREKWERDRRFRALLADSRAIIVNSRSVVHDIHEFFPDAKARVFPLPFCPPINPALFEEVEEAELRSYALPERYFIICNQFWVHKSHQTAFNALKHVKDAGFTDVHIVCTGNLHDYRFPGYVDRLRVEIGENGLTDRIHFLGVIPKRHQLAIMRRAVALIQPTLFEGGPGGGALYDAVSVATPVILSDIDVNREADIGVIDFFEAGSAENLAKKMMKALKNPPIRLATEETISLLLRRKREMGQAIMQAIGFTLGESLYSGSENSSSAFIEE